MKTYISYIEALARYNLSREELDALIESGQLNTTYLDDDGQERLLIYDDDLAAYVARREKTRT